MNPLERRASERVLAGETLASPRGAWGWDEWPAPIITPPNLWREFSAPLIVMDNVVEYLSPMKDLGVCMPIKLPCLAPPFPTYWLDAHRQTGSTTQKWWSEDAAGEGLPASWAIFVNSIRIDHENPDRDDDTAKGINHLHFESGSTGETIPSSDDVTWLVELMPFLDLGKARGERMVLGPMGSLLIQLDREVGPSPTTASSILTRCRRCSNPLKRRRTSVTSSPTSHSPPCSRPA